MRGNPERNLLKLLQTSQNRGAPFGVAELGRLGISAKRASRYVESGWLTRLGQGVYAFAGDSLDREATLLFLQGRVPGLHTAGRSALALQGVRQYLGNGQLTLWGDQRYTLPDWFTERFSARYTCTRLFDWSDPSEASRTLITPPGSRTGLHVSVPERAVLELLHEVDTRQALEEARSLLESLRSLRPATIGPLLSCCTRVKTVRLFLELARETAVLDVDALLARHPVAAGSQHRWIGRLADGTPLTLKPHG
jgi:hypothetical protein